MTPSAVLDRPKHAGPGFTPKDPLWILTHTPGETAILRPQGDGDDEMLPSGCGTRTPRLISDRSKSSARRLLADEKTAANASEGSGFRLEACQ